MLKQFLDLTVAYLEKGFEILASHLMTIEGMIALVFGLFLLGVIFRIRSY